MNHPSPHLHIPVPATRPGDPPDFSHIALSYAGEVRRPDPLDEPVGLRDLAYSLVRVLDDSGTARGDWSPNLDVDTLKRGLRAMMLTRAFEERMFNAHRQGKTTFFMRSLGEEAIGAASAMVLRADDMCFPTYRMMSWLIAREYPLLKMVNQIFSNEADPLGGRQLPVLYSAREAGFYSISGNLGTRFGHAVGWAMAAAYKKRDQVAIGVVGEGTTAEGNVHEALTFATVYRAPAILCITNNQWAISSFHGIAGGEMAPFAARAIGYGLPGLRVDGNDFLAVWSAVAWAAERARLGGGATLIEFVTYRAAGHSTSDDPARYRPAGDAACWPLGDPVARLRLHLEAIGAWSAEEHEALEKSLREQVRTAAKAGEAIGTFGVLPPSARTMFEHVYESPDWRHIEQRRELGV